MKQGIEPENTQNSPAFPDQLVFDQVTWVGSHGDRSTVRGKLLFADQGWVEEALLEVVQGKLKGTHADVKRADRHWLVNVALGGGTVKGTVSLQQTTKQPGAWRMAGKLETRNVALTRVTAFPTFSGELEADTVLSAQAATLGGLLDALKTQSQFTVRHAVVHGIDPARAVARWG